MLLVSVFFAFGFFRISCAAQYHAKRAIYALRTASVSSHANKTTISKIDICSFKVLKRGVVVVTLRANASLTATSYVHTIVRTFVSGSASSSSSSLLQNYYCYSAILLLSLQTCSPVPLPLSHFLTPLKFQQARNRNKRASKIKVKFYIRSEGMASHNGWNRDTEWAAVAVGTKWQWHQLKWVRLVSNDTHNEPSRASGEMFR